MAAAQKHVAFPTDWIFYPEWDADDMQEIMDAGGVDLNDAGLIAEDSLWDFQEACALLFHWWN